MALLLALAAVSAAPAAYAHHSYAMFDAEKTLQLTGTIKSVAWGNPHIWIVITTTKPTGEQAEWGLEGLSPVVLLRKGVRANQVKVGDKATAIVHPRRDGTLVASVIGFTFPDGRSVDMTGRQKAEGGTQ